MADEAKMAKYFVQNKIDWLTDGNHESASKAAMAKLRRGIGKAPGSMPELWAMTLDGLPETLTGKYGEPSYGEWAVHTALTLYAMHQQGKDLKSQCMSKSGSSLGNSVRRLIAPDGNNEEAIKRRFDAAATSASMTEFSHHLRGLIQLMKARDVPLDYPALAEDLYRFQFPSARDSVRLGWGRDYYRDAENKENENQIKDGNNDEK